MRYYYIMYDRKLSSQNDVKKVKKKKNFFKKTHAQHDDDYLI